MVACFEGCFHHLLEEYSIDIQENEIKTVKLVKIVLRKNLNVLKNVIINIFEGIIFGRNATITKNQNTLKAHQ